MLAYETKGTDGPGWALNIPNTPGSYPNTVRGFPFPVPYASDARRFQYSDSSAVRTRDEIRLGNLLIDYDLSFAKLTSSTAFWERKERLDTNIGPISGLVTGVGDSFPLQAQRLDNPKSYSQEFRLTSVPGRRFNWLVGVFLQRIDQRFSQSLADLSGLDIYYNYAVIQNQILRAPAPTSRVPSLQLSQFRDDQEAIYGQLSYALTPTLTADVSFRAFNLRQRAVADQSGFSFVGPGHFEQRNAAQVFTPKLNIAWKPATDRLFYATASKGYRTGIINFPVPTPACSVALTALGAAAGAQNVPPTKPDTVWNYEAGAKASFARGIVQINAAGYHINFNNLQTQVVLASLTPGGVTGGCTSLQVANVGNSKIDGAEVEMNVAVTPHLRLETSFSYTDARYSSNVLALNITRGTKVEGAPQFQGYGALQYGFNVGPRRGYLRGEVAYTGKVYNIPLDFVTTRPPFTTGDFADVNLRAGIDLTRNVDLSLFMTNVFDTFGVTRQLNQRDGAPPTVFTTRPRTTGATLRAHF
ncbi:MAG: TonB-dependent receptor [Sphingomonadaceae bacterium]|nr:TonB-dependent receptor [Sphingomonadaceae bacterium]